jgi:putative lipoic acid-binding regulatory protein
MLNILSIAMIAGVLAMSAKSLVLKQAQHSRAFRFGLVKTNMFKANGGEPKFPSIDETAKQIKLANALKDYKDGDENKKSVFEDHVTFPTEFMIKVIGMNEPTFIIDILNSVATVVNQAPEKIAFTTKETAGGKYLSISIKPFFKDADEVYAAYDAVSKDKRVKFVI